MGSHPPFNPGWAWFLDIDGTLLDIAPMPNAVKTGPSDTRLVTGLYSACRGALALISGRSIDGIDKLFYPLRLPAAGQHGIERRDAKGRIHRHPFPEEALRQAAAELKGVTSKHPGLLFEDKGASLALHYRLAPQLGALAHSAMHKAARHLGEGVEVQGGKMVVELKPSGRDKGIAIEEFMREPPFRGRTPVFLGDDLTDEDGFHVVNRLGGHSVKIGAGVTSARWRLRDAAAVRQWLNEALSGSRTGPSPAGQTPLPSPSRP